MKAIPQKRHGRIREKDPKELKAIWEYDENMPEEERQKRIGEIFDMLLGEDRDEK